MGSAKAATLRFTFSGAVLGLILLAMTFIGGTSQGSAAGDEYAVLRVEILEVDGDIQHSSSGWSCFDTTNVVCSATDGEASAPDFYPVVFIDGELFGGPGLTIDNTKVIAPGWTFEKLVRTGGGSAEVPVTIQIWDEDPTFNSDDIANLLAKNLAEDPDNPAEFSNDIDYSSIDLVVTQLTTNCLFIGDLGGGCGDEQVLDNFVGTPRPIAGLKFRITEVPVSTQAMVTAKIKRVEALDCHDPVTLLCNESDFYPLVSIDGRAPQGGEQLTRDNQDLILPNWTFSEIVNAESSALVSVEIWDDDGPLRGDDDFIDIVGGSSRRRIVSVDTGDFGIKNFDSSGADTGRARVVFEVEVRPLTEFANVTVEVEEVESLDCHDPNPTSSCSNLPDFYPLIVIDGTSFGGSSVALPDRETVVIPKHGACNPVTTNTPCDHWKFTHIVARSESVPIQVAVWDQDGALRFEDDQSDINPSSRRDIELSLNTEDCTVSGELSGECDVSLESEGTDETRSRVKFKISSGNVTAGDSSGPIAPDETDGVLVPQEPMAPENEVAVNEDVQVTAWFIAANNGPHGPATFNMAVGLIAPNGCEVIGTADTTVQLTLGAAAEMHRANTFTVRCSTTGSHNFAASSNLELVSDGFDPITDNNSATSELVLIVGESVPSTPTPGSGNSDDVVVTGTLSPGNITLTAPNDFGFDVNNFNRGQDNVLTISDLAIAADVPWQLFVADPKTNHTGHMLNGEGETLINSMRVQSAGYQEVDLKVPGGGMLANGVNSRSNMELQIKQRIESGDQAGAYSITLRFTVVGVF